MAFSLRAGTNWCHDFPKLARESGFRFNRNGTRARVDWKRIGSIDIDRVIQERDLSAIDDNVNNIVDCCLESEYDVKILDPNFVKLFRLAQLAIEYLLYCKRYLDHCVVILKDELRCKIEENAKLNNQVRVNKDTIEELQDRLKERSRVIETKLSDSHGEIHKCPQCPKTFVSSVFMNAHVNRRHPSMHGLSQLPASSPVLDERYRVEAEKLHNEIKSLKERLNLTERLIRKESDKALLSPDNTAARSSNERRGECNENPPDKDESRARYHEEIKHFKDTLFSEIIQHQQQQNLQFVDRKSMIRDDTEDCPNSNSKELIKEQETEIKRLRDQLYKRLTPDVEDIQAKLNNQEDVWQSKIENLEMRHRADIEKLYAQLTITRESAERMRIDYITKINDLERQSREHRTESLYLPDRNAQSEDQSDSESENIPFAVGPRSNNRLTSSKKDYAKKGHIVNCRKDESETGKLVHSKNSLITISSKRTTNQHSHFLKDRNKRTSLGEETIFTSPCNQSPKVHSINAFETNHLSRSLETNYANPREDAERVVGPISAKAEKAQVHEFKETIATIGNGDKKNETVREKLESSDSTSESETSSGSSSESSSSSGNNESSLVSESPDVDPHPENNEKRRASRIEVKSNNRNELPDQEEINNDNYAGGKDTVELLNSKLRDLGVDPEWQGIPKATLKQIMTTVRHHRKLNSKKYRKMDEIRRELFDQVTRKISSETLLEKMLSNAKGGRTWKALSTPDKNEEAHKSVSNNGNEIRRLSSDATKKQARRDSASHSKDITENEQMLRQVLKSKIPQTGTEINKTRVSRVVENNSTPLRRQSQSIVEPSGDFTSNLKNVSRSYESLESFNRHNGVNNTRQQRAVWERKIIVPESLVTSSPRKTKKAEEMRANESSTIAKQQKNDSDDRDEDSEDDVENDDDEFSKYPENRSINRSVIKSVSRGSAASLVKKKVVFDLENTTRESPERDPADKDDQGNTTKDCEISSIDDEINEKEPADREEKQSGSDIVLKTFQSEKIARISKQIEQQLSVARRKPVGSVEAMFADKLSVRKDDKKVDVLEVSKFNPDVTHSTGDTADAPHAAPRTLINTSSVGRRNVSSLDYGSKESNLDRDIDELLEIE